MKATLALAAGCANSRGEPARVGANGDRIAGVAPARLWLVEPWFAAPGHPAQTLRSTAEALRDVPGLTCLVPHVPSDLEPIVASIATRVPVQQYRTASQALPVATAFALAALRRRMRVDDVVLFLDAHLVTLAALWGQVGPRVPPRRLAVLYLRGPERIAGNALAAGVVRRFLERPYVRLFLRTEELAAAWSSALPATVVPRIGTLPTLEVPEMDEQVTPRRVGGPTRFLVTGQLRPGKGLELLVPLFQSRPDLGVLTVAGAFATPTVRSAMPIVAEFTGLREGYLSEAELLATVADHDYLLMLYQGWDQRMEAATLFLAARVGRPVVTLDAGWCGRMVRTHACGWLVAQGASDFGAELARLPAPGTDAYAAMLAGMTRLRDAHRPAVLRERFLATLTD